MRWEDSFLSPIMTLKMKPYSRIKKRSKGDKRVKVLQIPRAIRIEGKLASFHERDLWEITDDRIPYAFLVINVLEEEVTVIDLTIYKTENNCEECRILAQKFMIKSIGAWSFTQPETHVCRSVIEAKIEDRIHAKLRICHPREGFRYDHIHINPYLDQVMEYLERYVGHYLHWLE